MWKTTRWIGPSTHWIGIFCAAWLSSTGCTKIYTEADIREEESHDAEEARAQENVDRRIEEAGGVNADAMETVIEAGTMDSDR